MPTNSRPDQPIPVPEPDVVRPPTPSEEPQPEKGPDLPQPGPDVVVPPEPDVITPQPPQEISTRTSSLKANEDEPDSRRFHC